MASKRYKVGATVVLDGEREYKQALGDINAGLKVNYAEMQQVAAEYDRASDSQEALAAKTKALDGAIAAQTEKVRTLEGALQNSIEKNGEGSKTTLQWRASLVQAETQLAKMNNKMSEYEEELTTTNAGTHSLADAVRGLTDGLGLQLPPAADQAIDKLSGISVEGAALIGILGGIIFKLGEFTVETARAADEILTLSSTTGIGTDALQEFEYASELLDVSSDTMQQTMTKMIRTMSDAQRGSETAAEAYSKLKVRVTESNGKLRDANVVYYEVIDKLGKIANETERDAISMQIFGRSARDLNPLIEAGSDKLAEYAREAHELGYVMDEETLNSFGQMEDAMQRFNKQQDAVSRSLAEALLPIMTELYEIINAIPTPVLTTIVVVGAMVAVLGLLAKTISTVATANKLRAAANLILSGTNTALSASNTAVATTNTAVATSSTMLGVSMKQMLPIILIIVGALALLAIVLALVRGNSEKTNSELNKMKGTMGQMGNMNIQSPNYSGMNYSNMPGYASGTSYHNGGFARVGEAGPETVWMPQGSKVWPNGESPGGDTFYITIDANNVREFNDIIEIAQNAKSSRRRGYSKNG